MMPVRIDGTWIGHSDGTGTSNLEMVGIIALDQRLVDEQTVCPWAVRNVKIMSKGRDIVIVSQIIGLPENRIVFNVKIHIAFHRKMCGDIAPSFR